MTNHPPSVLWHCWLGHQTCKNRGPCNLYCVGADVKPCSINQSINPSHLISPSYTNLLCQLLDWFIDRYDDCLFYVWACSVFGELKSFRIPKKPSGTGTHRGFGFADFLTKEDAKVSELPQHRNCPDFHLNTHYTPNESKHKSCCKSEFLRVFNIAILYYSRNWWKLYTHEILLFIQYCLVRLPAKQCIRNTIEL